MAYSSFESFTIVDSDELNKVKPYLEDAVGAIISISYSEHISLKIYFDELCYDEAGVALFGNSGDCTVWNAYYWDKGEATPFYNKGAMIWGNIYMDGDEVNWYPYDNKMDDEMYNDMYHEWNRDEYGIDNQEQHLDLIKRFIMKDEAVIRNALANMGVKVSDLLEF